MESSVYFATVARGLEAVAAQELQALGASEVEPGFTGVQFRGDRPLLYHVNLWARLPFRVLEQIRQFPCRDADQLYQGIQEIDWAAYLSPEQTFAVRATGKTPQLNHTHFTALQVKNAIVDQQRQRLGQRSSIDTHQPDVWINVFVSSGEPGNPRSRPSAIVSLDSTGESLHRRGYRPAMGVAPLKETLAAALIALTDWTPERPFLDPLCGSGTLPIEAAMKGLNIAPGLFREQFAFERWRDFDGALWSEMKREAIAQQHSHLPAPIIGSDADAAVLQDAQVNARECGLEAHLKLVQQSLSEVEPVGDRGVILCNPPYGERIGEVKSLGALYRELGDVFKQRFKGWTAYVLSGNQALIKQIGLKPARRTVVYNGAIECRLLKYELY
ncbi:MAG: THUMP domain-containing protein [Synechococcales bacterium]|nr:THUMP domain-containing protein [Synechococcales bacterium]